jgi:hypothetical protein
VITLAQFRARCPEFLNTSDAAVNAALAQAEVRTDAEVFGAVTDEAHQYLTCHILATQARGREAAIKDMPGETTYSLARKGLEYTFGGGWGIL